MVTNVTNFSRSGLSDWVFQRVSAVILALYTLCILGVLLTNPDMTYDVWVSHFDSIGMKLFTLLTLISILAHAWIGMWTIATDYLTPMALGKAATPVRVLFQLACILVSFGYLVWGIEILWGQ